MQATDLHPVGRRKRDSNGAKSREMIKLRTIEERYGPALKQAREDFRHIEPYKAAYCSDTTYR